MNRLHKKCIYASAGLHALLISIVLFGAAFFVKEKTVPEVQPITFVPSKLIDDLLSNSGGAAPEPVNPPPPAPLPEPPPVAAAPPELASVPPKITPPPEPMAPTPKRNPTPIPVEQKPPPPAPTVTKKEEPKPEPPKRVERPKPQIRPTFSSPTQSHTAAEAQRREREKAETDRLAKLKELQQNLRKGLSPKLDWQSPGAGGEAYANYGQEIMRLYEQAWRPPAEVASDSAIVTVQVRVSRNGKVLADPITSRSGHGAVDRSVQDALDRVRAAGLPPFPAGAKDNERSFVIKFNLQSKRS
jgi:TonB family protein